MDGAEKGESGNVARIRFDWHKEGNGLHKGWTNTVVANLTLEPGRLTVEANSERRTKKARERVEKLLGKGVRHRSTAFEPPEAAMEEREGTPSRTQASDETEELMKNPEIRAQVEAMFRQQWESWPDQKLPALGGLTPRKAAKTKEGRELLEALLYGFESENEREKDNLLKPDVPALRRELGLE